MAEVRETGPGNEAHLASADRRNVHENPFLIRSVSTRLLIE
jgi:hypothetical protein